MFSNLCKYHRNLDWPRSTNCEDCGVDIGCCLGPGEDKLSLSFAAVVQKNFHEVGDVARTVVLAEKMRIKM